MQWWSAVSCQVAVDTVTGDVIGTVYRGSDGVTLYGPTIDAQGRTLFGTEGQPDACAFEMVRIDLFSGARTGLGPGSLGALSRDGRRMVYLPSIDDVRFADRATEEHFPCLRSTVVLRDLVTGEEREVTANGLGWPDSTILHQFSWSPDGATLAVWSFGSDVGGVRLIDVATGDVGIVTASAAIRRRVGFDGANLDIGWTPADRLVVQVYPYDPRNPYRDTRAVGDVRRGQAACGSSALCVELDQDIGLLDPDHVDDLARVAGVTLRWWDGRLETLGPHGTTQLPDGGRATSALWPVSVMLRPFD